MLLALTNGDWIVLALSAFAFGVGCGVFGFALFALALRGTSEPEEILPKHQPDFVDRDLIKAASARTDEHL